jgi:hypothetical protein
MSRVAVFGHSRSEHELDRHLADASRSGAAYHPKRRIVDNAVRAIELCLIETIEEFPAELESLRFSEMYVFEQGQIPIVGTGSMEEAARGIPKLPEIFKAE